MKQTAGIEVQVSGAKVLKLVEASKLSLNDKFMKYEPKRGTNEAKLKETLSNAIQSGTLSDFWRPIMDPSFDETGEGICYVAGKKPALGKSFNWWKENAKKVGLEVGTKSQYVAFLGCFIKKLVEKGWDVEKAWYAVCSDSKELGHYRNSKDAKYNFEMTGSREVCKFFDLGNTYKILAEDEEEKTYCVWIAGGCYNNFGNDCPLADLGRGNGPFSGMRNSVGWLVLNQ